ncbi:hypothetical protein CLV84_2504 [Neolewinella xylanilytica]|uniref:Sulfotransferase family protein n=1 Tax=Neolewinella xylanilytica TaxID=1514080 RepID=A0A2S6I3F2_9BACT|nr:sulfotransferase family protein [Neolewinella xylanilytica]PPK85601.1 hypothetical protein CLV84_2504 [Neolewinella xylanilytica]
MKIFGIGLSRTGTTSLSSALELLGYRSFHFPFIRSFLGKIYIKQQYLDNYDALTDTPVALLYKELDKKYPGSKFIYTVRDMDGWLASCEKYPAFHPASDFSESNKITARLRRRLFGSEYFDREKFKAAYLRHESEVMEYFKDRPEDLLVLNVTTGDGWEPLCQFLGKDIPEVPFPNKNKKKAPAAN